MYPDRSDILAHCPYGQPGDRLWVRETWMASGFDASVMENQYITYKADDFERHITRPCSTLWAQKVWRPSIFMPRWASRIFLEVTAIRIERVQDITGEDIEREGIDFPDGLSVERVGERFRPFMDLWDSINLVHGYGWDADPWVWAIEFKRVSA
jgi:hypothetical protein